MTLTVYQGNPNKYVLIPSTVHKSISVSDGKKMVPDTIQYYKYRIDVLEQMARRYTTKASSRQWTLQVFCNIINLAGINSWILYKEAIGKNISRNKFLLQLILELQMKETN